MADAAKRYLRDSKVKVGTRVFVNRAFFYSDGNANEVFFGEIMKVLPNENLRVKWDIDNTQSIQK